MRILPVRDGRNVGRGLGTPCLMPSSLSLAEKTSDDSIDVVPTSTGCPAVHVEQFGERGVRLALDRLEDAVGHVPPLHRQHGRHPSTRSP